MKKIWKGWVVGLLILLIGSPALAGGANVYFIVKDHNNSNIGSGKYAECYDGTVSIGPSGVSGTLSPDSPAGPNIGGRVYTNSSSYISDSTTGDNELFDGRPSKTVNIVAWEGTSISAVIAAKGYYGYESYTTSGTTATPVDVNKTLQTKYKADVPPPPTASAGGYNLTWNEAQSKYLVAFTVSATEGTDYLTEYNSSGWTLAVVRSTDDWSTAQTYNAKSQSIVETNPDDPYYIAGGTYKVRAQAGNNFGLSAWGPETIFTIPTGGDMAQQTVSIPLVKQTDGFGINCFGVPFSSNYNSTGGAVQNMQALIEAINSAGDGYVSTIGYWSNGQEVGFALSDSGSVVEKVNTDQSPADITLSHGMGIQVSVTADKTLVLRNY